MIQLRDDRSDRVVEVIELQNDATVIQLAAHGDLHPVAVPVQPGALPRMPGQDVGGFEPILADDFKLFYLRHGLIIINIMVRRPASGRERAFGRGVIEELRRARRQQGLSVSDVVQGTTASRDTVYALEAERILSPGFFTVVELAGRLNLSVEYLAAQGRDAAAEPDESAEERP